MNLTEKRRAFIDTARHIDGPLTFHQFQRALATAEVGTYRANSEQFIYRLIEQGILTVSVSNEARESTAPLAVVIVGPWKRA